MYDNTHMNYDTTATTITITSSTNNNNNSNNDDNNNNITILQKKHLTVRPNKEAQPKEKLKQEGKTQNAKYEMSMKQSQVKVIKVIERAKS